LRADLVEEARALDVNLSREFESHLERVLAERRAEKWRIENKKALAAYEDFVEKNGIWNEDSRGW
jgi:antitoxin CcdA